LAKELQAKERSKCVSEEKTLIEVLEEIADAVFLVADSMDRLAQVWMEMLEASRKAVKAGA